MIAGNGRSVGITLSKAKRAVFYTIVIAEAASRGARRVIPEAFPFCVSVSGPPGSGIPPGSEYLRLPAEAARHPQDVVVRVVE